MWKLQKSKNKNKKYDVWEINNDEKIGPIISFGANGYKDFIIYNQEKGLIYATIRKKKYIARHKTNEKWTNLKKAGTWSRYILWNQPTLEDSIHDMENRFKIQIIYR